MQCGGETDAWQEYTAQGSLLKHMSLLPALARQRAQADAMLLINKCHSCTTVFCLTLTDENVNIEMLLDI